jgi:hypothetical protein
MKVFIAGQVQEGWPPPVPSVGRGRLRWDQKFQENREKCVRKCQGLLCTSRRRLYVASIGIQQGWNVPSGLVRNRRAVPPGFGPSPSLCACAAVVVNSNGRRQGSFPTVAPSEPIGLDFRGIFTGGCRPSAGGSRANGSFARKSVKLRR